MSYSDELKKLSTISTILQNLTWFVLGLVLGKLATNALIDAIWKPPKTTAKSNLPHQGKYQSGAKFTNYSKGEW